MNAIRLNQDVTGRNAKRVLSIILPISACEFRKLIPQGYPRSSAWRKPRSMAIAVIIAAADFGRLLGCVPKSPADFEQEVLTGWLAVTKQRRNWYPPALMQSRSLVCRTAARSHYGEIKLRELGVPKVLNVTSWMFLEGNVKPDFNPGRELSENEFVFSTSENCFFAGVAPMCRGQIWEEVGGNIPIQTIRFRKLISSGQILLSIPLKIALPLLQIKTNYLLDANDSIRPWGVRYFIGFPQCTDSVISYFLETQHGLHRSTRVLLGSRGCFSGISTLELSGSNKDVAPSHFDLPCKVIWIFVDFNRPRPSHDFIGSSSGIVSRCTRMYWQDGLDKKRGSKKRLTQNMQMPGKHADSKSSLA